MLTLPNTQDTHSEKELLNMISLLRNRLIETGLNEGLNSMKTIKISQELDIVINKFHRIKYGVNYHEIR